MIELFDAVISEVDIVFDTPKSTIQYKVIYPENVPGVVSVFRNPWKVAKDTFSVVREKCGLI